jgi:hypothetical protein
LATINTINASDAISASRTDLNTNFANLNSDKEEVSNKSTDTSLSANSDTLYPSQKAIKTYVDTQNGSNASESARGIVEEANDAEVTAGTAIGGTGAKLFITPAKLATYLASVIVKYKNGQDSKALSDATGTQVITHGLNRTPKRIKIAIELTGTGAMSSSYGSYIVADSTYAAYTRYWNPDTTATETASTAFICRIAQGSDTDYQTATITATSTTTFTITWTKSNTPSGTAQFIWEVEG